MSGTGRPGRTWAWWALAAFCALWFGVSAVGATYGAGRAISAGNAGALVWTLVGGAFGLLFWRWIGLGAMERARATDHRADAARMGPWGVVGVVLTALVLGGLVAGSVWAALGTDRSRDAAEEVRRRAELEARRSRLTVEKAEAARAERSVWAWEDGEGVDPFDELLDVRGAEVVDVVVEGGRALVLLDHHDAPPCVVLEVDRNDVVRSRLSDRC